MVRRKFKKKEIALSLGFILNVVTILTFYIWHQVESVRLGYETRELEAKLQSLKNEVETLETKRAALLRLDRVEKIAEDELGLKPPDEDQVIYTGKNHDPTERTR
jgi:cell division protein FtsL